MARPKSTTTKTTTTKTTKANTIAKTSVTETENIAVAVNEPTENTIETVERKDYSKKAKIPKDYDIPVKSNVQGKLTYTSKKTGYTEEWDEIGMVVFLEYDELVSMRNAHKKFYEDNWILIEDTEDYTAEEIYYALNVDKYYKNIAIFETLDDVFNLGVSDIEQIVPTLSAGYKRSIASRAMQLIVDNDERMDSTAKIKALEKALGINLREE